MKGERQTSQLTSFLEAENRSFRQQNKQLKDLLALNRQALNIALKPREGEQQLPVLVSLLFEENSKLLARCGKLRQQLQQKSCQVLISEQIASASNEHQKYVSGQLKERLKILKKQIETKEQRISDLLKQNGKHQKNEETDGDGELNIIEYTDVTKVSEKLFKEAESLRREIELRGQQITKLREQKDELLKLNLILTRLVNEYKIYSCQSTSSQKRDFNTSSSDLSKFLKYQSKIAENSDDQSGEEHVSSDQEEPHSSSEEDEYLQQQIEPEIKKPPPMKLMIEKIEKQKQPTVGKTNKVVMPKLQLKKAKQIQTLIVKKINHEEKKKQGGQVKDEKWKKLQADMEELRKKLGSQIIVKLRFERQNLFLKKFIGQLGQRNQLLLKERQQKTIQNDYEKARQHHQDENVETLLDICRDVTLNERLRSVCKGRERLQQRKDISSKQV